MPDKDERHAAIEGHVNALRKWIDEDADGLYELMERLAQGNPRLTKAERTSISGFINVLINALGAYARQIEDSHALWTRLDENAQLLKKRNEQHEQINKLIMELIRDRNWDGLVEYERRYGE